MTSIAHSIRAQALRGELLAWLGAGALAFVLLFFAGFAESAVFHDSAHDARHAIGFACH